MNWAFSTNLMKHETLAMEKNTDPFSTSVDNWLSNLDLLHMAHVTPISDVASNSEVVEVVGAFVLRCKSP